MIFKNKIDYLLKLTSISLIFVFIGCNSKNNKYIPSISYNEIETTNEVRLELPNGESKIIYKIDEPIFESGKKCPQKLSQTLAQPMSGLDFLNNDSAYKLVNTSYVKLSGGKFDLFYIYQKKDLVIVYREQIWVSGVNDYDVIFKGNIQLTKGDELKKINNELSKKNTEVITEYTSDYEPNNTIKFIVNGKNITLNEYQNESLTSSLKGKVFNDKSYINSDFNAGIIYYFEGDKLCYGYEGVPDDNCFSKTKETVNGVETIFFRGEKLSSGDKIIKINWGMDNTTNFSRDWNKDNPRFSSEKIRVTSGKVWILLYIDEHYFFENLRLDNVPQLFIDNSNLDWTYRRNFSDINRINISSAKIENLIFQSNQIIFAVSNKQKGNSTSEDFYDYNGEMWFLETTMNAELEQKRNAFSLNELKEQNRRMQKNIDAANSAIRAQRWKENAERKMMRGY